MWLWISLRRSGSTWTLLRGPCTGTWCWRTTATWSQWVRTSFCVTQTCASKCLSCQLLWLGGSWHTKWLLWPSCLPQWRSFLCRGLTALPPCGQTAPSLLPSVQCAPRPLCSHVVGHPVSKPDVISRLEQGEDPWIIKGDTSHWIYPGKNQAEGRQGKWNISLFVLFSLRDWCLRPMFLSS